MAAFRGWWGESERFVLKDSTTRGQHVTFLLKHECNISNSVRILCFRSVFRAFILATNKYMNTEDRQHLELMYVMQEVII